MKLESCEHWMWYERRCMVADAINKPFISLCNRFSSRRLTILHCFFLSLSFSNRFICRKHFDLFNRYLLERILRAIVSCSIHTGWRTQFSIDTCFWLCIFSATFHPELNLKSIYNHFFAFSVATIIFHFHQKNRHSFIHEVSWILFFVFRSVSFEHAKSCAEVSIDIH